MCGTFSHEDRPRVELAGLQAGPPQAETHAETDPRSAPYSESCLTPPLKDKTVDLAKSNISQKDSGLDRVRRLRRGPPWAAVAQGRDHRVRDPGRGTRDSDTTSPRRSRRTRASRSSCPSWLNLRGLLRGLETELRREAHHQRCRDRQRLLVHARRRCRWRRIRVVVGQDGPVLSALYRSTLSIFRPDRGRA